MNSDTDGSICESERRLGERDRFYLRNLTPGSKFSIFSQNFNPSLMTGILQRSADWRNLYVDADQGTIILSGEVATKDSIFVTLPKEHPDYPTGRWYGSYTAIAHGTWNGTLRTTAGSFPVHAYTTGVEPLTFAIFDAARQTFHSGIFAQFVPAR